MNKCTQTNKIKDLQNSLREIMWACCGIVKCEKDLLKSLEDQSTLEMKLNKQIFLQKNNFLNFSDFNSSLFTFKAMIISSKVIKENRGSHQRSDFQD